MQDVVRLFVHDGLLKLLWVDVGETCAKLAGTIEDLYTASTTVDDKPVYVAQEAYPQGSPKRRKSSLPFSETEFTPLTTTCMTIETRLRGMLSIRGRRVPTRKAPEGVSTAVLLREHWAVRRYNQAEKQYVPVKVDWDARRKRAVLDHGEADDDEIAWAQAFASSPLAKLSRHGLIDSNATGNPDHKPETKQRLRCMRKIDEAVGGSVVLDHCSLEVVLQHPTGGDIAAARRCVVCVMVMASKRDPLTLRDLLDTVNAVCGVAAFQHYNSYTARNESKLNFFMWWHVLRKILKDELVMVDSRTTSTMRGLYKIAVDALPRGYLDSDEDVRTKADAHWWAMNALTVLAATGIELTYQTEKVQTVMQASICAQWDVVNCVEDLAAHVSVFNAELRGRPFADRLSALRQLDDFAPLLERLLVWRFEGVVARVCWRDISRVARKHIRASTASDRLIDLAGRVLSEVGLSFADPIWRALTKLCDAVHPLLHIISWNYIDLGLAESFCNTQFHDVEDKDMPGALYDVWVMHGTYNTVVSPAFPACVYDDELAELGFTKTAVQKRIFVMFADAPMWLMFDNCVANLWLPYDAADQTEEIESRLAPRGTASRFMEAMPTKPSFVLPAAVLVNSHGTEPFDAVVRIREVQMPKLYALPWWIFNRMTWFWEETLPHNDEHPRGVYTAITCMPLPWFNDDVDDSVAPFVGYGVQLVYFVYKQASNVKTNMWSRPLMTLEEFVDPHRSPEMIARDLFLDANTVPVAGQAVLEAARQRNVKVVASTQLPPWAHKVATSPNGRAMQIQSHVLDKSLHNGVLDALTNITGSLTDVFPYLVTQMVKVGAKRLLEPLHKFFGLEAYCDRLFRLYTSIDIEDNRRIAAKARESEVRVNDLENQIKLGQQHIDMLGGGGQQTSLSFLSDLHACLETSPDNATGLMAEFRSHLVNQEQNKQRQIWINGRVSALEDDVASEVHIQQINARNAAPPPPPPPPV
ncbi:MAG: hypothetical protein ACPGR8_14930 [Limisphaerales bacterium]